MKRTHRTAGLVLAAIVWTAPSAAHSDDGHLAQLTDTRVGYDGCPCPCGHSVWCNEPPDTKGHFHGPQYFQSRI